MVCNLQYGIRKGGLLKVYQTEFSMLRNFDFLIDDSNLNNESQGKPCNEKIFPVKFIASGICVWFRFQG